MILKYLTGSEVSENVKMTLGVCISLDLNKAQYSLHNSHELYVQNIPFRLVLNWFHATKSRNTVEIITLDKIKTKPMI